MTRKLILTYEPPPIPLRNTDWCCYEAGKEENGGYGWGETAAEALADWAEKHAEEL